jgi:hypothetical protein
MQKATSLLRTDNTNSQSDNNQSLLLSTPHAQSSPGEFNTCAVVAQSAVSCLDPFVCYLSAPDDPFLVQKQLFIGDFIELQDDFDVGISVDFNSLFGQTTSHTLTSAAAYQMILEDQWRTDRLRTLLRLTSSDWKGLHFSKLPSGRERIALVSESQTNFVSEVVSSFARAIGSSLSESLTNWIQMQLQWIVWTLASHERRSKRHFGNLLTLENILACLQHRHSMYTNTALFSPQSLLSKHRHSKFRGQIMMSPLQRCSEIRTFLSPLVVCLSLKTARDKSHEMLISDGWWWVTALPDPIIQTKLLDTVSGLSLLSL